MQFADIEFKPDEPCRMRDGTVLYADIYEPSASGEFPVLLMRQLYGRRLASTVTSAHPVWFARQGYIVVVQDVRGIGDSEGTLQPFVQEEEDGYDAVEWAARLPRSNGKVGMYGFSYQGFTQLAAAAAAPPSLAAIAPGMTAADLYHKRFYPHGRFAWGAQLRWAFQIARDQAQRAGDQPGMIEADRLMRNPGALQRQVPLRARHPLLEKYCPFFYEWIERPEYDEFWEARNWIPKLAKCRVPSFHIGGWYDTFLGGTLQSFAAMSEAVRSPGPFHRLTIGPWPHIPWGRMTGGVDHGPLAGGDIHREQLRWFDYWLKDVRGDADLAEEPAIRYFEYGSMSWRTADRLPCPESDVPRKVYYLRSTEHPANGALGGGRLLPEPETSPDPDPDVFVYDARLPMECESYVPADRSALQDRNEILVYTSAPMTEPLHVFGAPNVIVSAQSSGGPTDLVAVLTMVDVTGKARFLSIGREEVFAEDGVWAVARIAMRPFAARFAPGSSLRLELTGSAFPLFARHPNGIAASEIPFSEQLGIASVAVKNSSVHASRLELPVIRVRGEGGES